MPANASQPAATQALILGAGPAGLAAGHRLSRAGVPTLILEKSASSGGLMRSIRHGDFFVDIGRKELCNRIGVVDRLWEDLLGKDYRPYPHRIGVLADGRILEVSRSYRGLRRGMPWGMFLASVGDLVWSWARQSGSSPRNYEEFWYGVCGRRFSRIFAQGYWEKFRGVKWADMPPPPKEASGDMIGLLHRVKQAFGLNFGGGEEIRWRHPAKGTGQICELLEQEIQLAGGRLQFHADVREIVAADERIASVTAQIGDNESVFQPAHVVAAIPIERLAPLLTDPRLRLSSAGDGMTTSSRRGVVLVYLFLDEPPRFPHVWLEVTSPGLQAGRVTNYAALNGDMVPPGKTCLCVEFFCHGRDPLLEADNEALADLALRECASYGLLDPLTCFDRLILKLPDADPATSWRDWQDESRQTLVADLRRFENLYFVNHPGTDRATQAGIEAADAILSADRARFDELTDSVSHKNSTQRTWASDLLRARL